MIYTKEVENMCPVAKGAKHEPAPIPEEGKVADFFLKYRSIKDKNDRNVIFIQETDVTCENILAKLKSLQVRT